MADDNKLSFEIVKGFWPVVVSVALMGVAYVRTDAKAGETSDRVTYLYTYGSPAVMPHIASMDSKLDGMQRSLDHMQKIIDEDHVTRLSVRSKLNGL